jgi:hypothetical protein
MSRAAAVRIQEIDLSTRVASFAGAYGAICIPVKKGAKSEPELVISDKNFLDIFTPNSRVEVGYDLGYFSALAYLERSDKLWVQGVMKDASFAGAVVNKTIANAELPASPAIADVAQYAFSGTEAEMLIYGSSVGAWGNDIGIKILTNASDSDNVPELDSFRIQVFKKGFEGSPVEEFFCSRTQGKKDGYGNNMFVEDVLKASNYIRAVNNPAVTGDPALQATILYLGSGTDGLAVTDSEMISAAQTAFSNVEDLPVTLLMDAGWATAAYGVALDSIAKSRMDCVAILSTPYAAEVAANFISSLSEYRKTTLNLNSSYSGLYTPHLKIRDRFNDREIFVSPDGYVAGSISFNSNNSEIWFPPAGFRRGLLNVVGVSRKLESGNLDVLSKMQVNPIRQTKGRGIVIWGQKTLLARPSALDRMNVRLLLILIEPALKEFAEDYLFEFNDSPTRSEISVKIDSYMSGIKGRRGVYDYQVICDTSNNTPDVIDNNQLYIDVFIKPNKSIEDIPLRIIITSTGASFSNAAQSI